jgi:hypothetical protein
MRQINHGTVERQGVTASSVNARGRSDAIKSAERESDGTAVVHEEDHSVAR